MKSFHTSAILYIVCAVGCAGCTQPKPAHAPNAESTVQDSGPVAVADTINTDTQDFEFTVERSGPATEITIEVGPVEENPYVLWPSEDSTILCQTGGKSVIYYNDNLFKMSAITIGRNKIIEAPILKYDSLAPTRYRISDVYHSITVDFSKTSDIKALKRFNTPLRGFTPYFKNYSRTVTGADESTACSAFYMDFPDDSIQHADLINRWLVSWLNVDEHRRADNDSVYPKYRGSCANKRAIARYYADRFFDCTSPDCSTLFTVFDMRATAKTDRYVTYQRYTYNYECGMHGYYTERIMSFDIENNQTIDAPYLFKKERMDKVTELLVRTAIRDEHYCTWNDVSSFESEVKKFQSAGFGDIGITSQGVVCSYQPYDIDCFAAGCYHFLLPYDRLLPYMTDRAKHCVGLD